ncbi:hypothetical protein ACOXXX_07110 [Thalassococcus sp. BH17M4-6]|uniref:hypothetical protein n=1 Tax=Thalassococcus sp. BH17M4-6 TaxID=3413148 RepID=UPI003BCC92D5
MTRKMTSVIAICTGLGLAGPAMADCKAELAELTGKTQMDSSAGISKDGSLAPLETAEGDSTGMSDGGTTETAQNDDGMSDEQDGISKDGSLAPLENADAGSDDMSDSDAQIAKDGDTAPLETDTSAIATSGQAAADQQDMAAGEKSQEYQDAIEVAEAALEAGNESACMEAVEEARSL